LLHVLRRAVTAALSTAVMLVALPAAANAGSPFPMNEPFTGTSIGAQWHIGGSALLTAPSIDPDGAGWLRLTSATGNQFGYIVNDTAFPADNGILVDFDYATYGGTGADGLSFFLYDGATAYGSFQAGASGGSLGYAACDAKSNTGLTNAYIGVGFDEYGNFTNLADDCGGTMDGSTPHPNYVSVRGSAADNYQLLTSAPATGGLTGNRSNVRHVTVSVTQDLKLSVYIKYPNGTYQTVTSAYQLPAPPASNTLKFGFAGSTGGATNIHEIRNTKVVKPADLTTSISGAPTHDSRTGTYTWTVTVANSNDNDTVGSTVKASSPGGTLQNVTWTCAGGACGAASGTGLPDTTVDLLKGTSATYTVTAEASPTTDYASLQVDAQPIGATGELNPTDNVATSNIDIDPVVDADPTVSVVNATGYTGTATASAGTYRGGGLTVTRHWQRCDVGDASGSTCVDIPGATASSYTVSLRDYALRLREHVANTQGATDAYSTIYSTFPDTSLTSAPPAVTTSKTATFALTSPTAGAKFEISVDGLAWTACAASCPVTVTSDGGHTVRVRAVYAGLADQTPAAHAWTLDTTAPAAPAAPIPGDGARTNDTTPKLEVTAEPGSTVTFSIDDHVVGTATADGDGHATFTPSGPLGDGPHTMKATATDGAGNVSSASPTWTFTVDTVAPEPPTIGTAPAETSSDTAPTFAFSDEGGVHFECSLDGGAWAPCPSPARFDGLPDGPHVLLVHAIDEAGNASANQRYGWTVDTSRPAAPALLGGPDNRTTGNSAHFEFSAEPGATLECSVDGGSWTPCPPVLDLVGLAPGKHALEVRQVDLAGNTSGAERREWVVGGASTAGRPHRAQAVLGATATVHDRRSVSIGCALDAGILRRCRVSLYAHGRLIGRATRSVTGAHGRTIVHVTLNARGRRLLRGRIGGLPVTTRVAATTDHGVLRAAGSGRVYAPVVFSVPILFDTARDSLDRVALRLVRAISRDVRHAKRITCEGYTDSRSGSVYNRDLAFRRAKRVCTTLAQLGVRARVRAVSLGESRPSASNRTPNGRRLNRRVLVRVVY